MAETPSNMVQLGSPLPKFELPDFDGTMHTSSDYQNTPLQSLRSTPMTPGLIRGMTPPT